MMAAILRGVRDDFPVCNRPRFDLKQRMWRWPRDGLDWLPPFWIAALDLGSQAIPFVTELPARRVDEIDGLAVADLRSIELIAASH